MPISYQDVLNWLNEHKSEVGGAVTGATLGGLLGHRLGRGAGLLAGAALGGAGGYYGGGYLRDLIMQYLNKKKVNNLPAGPYTDEYLMQQKLKNSGMATGPYSTGINTFLESMPASSQKTDPKAKTSKPPKAPKSPKTPVIPQSLATGDPGSMPSFNPDGSQTFKPKVEVKLPDKDEARRNAYNAQFNAAPPITGQIYDGRSPGSREQDEAMQGLGDYKDKEGTIYPTMMQAQLARDAQERSEELEQNMGERNPGWLPGNAAQLERLRAWVNNNTPLEQLLARRRAMREARKQRARQNAAFKATGWTPTKELPLDF